MWSSMSVGDPELRPTDAVLELQPFAMTVADTIELAESLLGPCPIGHAAEAVAALSKDD